MQYEGQPAMIFIDISYADGHELVCSSRCARRLAAQRGYPFSPHRLVHVYPSDYDEYRGETWNQTCPYCGKNLFDE